MADLGQTIGVITRDKTNVKQQYATRDSVTPVFKLFKETLRVKEGPTRITKVAVGGTNCFIWGHPKYGIWGTAKWGDASLANRLFILGHAAYGVLGVSILGDLDFGGGEVIRVVNPDNQFVDTLRGIEFKDTGSNTVTWDTANYRIGHFATGKSAYSLPIYLNKTNVYKATLTLSGSILTVGGTAMVTPYLSADGGSNWEAVTNGSEHTFTTFGSDLRWRADYAYGSALIEANVICSYSLT